MRFFGPVLKAIVDQLEASESNSAKNILNCFLHLFLFESLGTKPLTSILKLLLTRFEESDLENLVFLLHNVGYQLRKQDPAALLQFLEMFQQKKNSYQA